MTTGWPPARGTSPFRAAQAAGARLASIGVEPWIVEVSRTLRSVTVEIAKPGDDSVVAEIKRALAPIRTDVVWHEGSYEVVDERS